MTSGTLRRRLDSLVRSPGFWILLAAAFLYGWNVVPYWKASWDSATYISLAASIAEGKGYSYAGYPHTKYPPGFPLLLAPIVVLAGKNYLLMRLLMATCAVASVGMAYLLIRRIASTSVAVAVALATATSYALYFEATGILSDLPYMVVSLCALYATDRFREGFSRGVLLGVIACVIAASSFRAVGLVLAPAIVLSILLDARGQSFPRRLRAAAAVAAAMAIATGLWVGRNATVSQRLPPNLSEGIGYEREVVLVDPSSSHSETVGWATLTERVGRNVDYYNGIAASMLTARRAKDPIQVKLLGCLLVAGWAVSMFRRRGVVEYYTPLYAAAYLLWPAHQGDRFFVPILPMLLFYGLQPLLALADAASGFVGKRLPDAQGAALRSGARGLLLASWTAALLVWNQPLLSTQINTEHQKPYYRGVQAEYIDAFLWIRENTPDDAVIITNRAPWCVLWTGRRSFTVPQVSDNREILDSIGQNGGTHAIANAFTKRYLNRAIEAFPERFRERERIGTTIVYEFVR